MKKVALHSLADTEKLAKDLAKTLRGGDVIALTGPLGAGKTTFTQALGRELGIHEVKSPTFIVLHLHHIAKNKTKKFKAKNFCHVDAYRMKDIDELAAIGFYDYAGAADTITIIEWAEKIKPALPKNVHWFTFSFSKNKRTVAIA